jgi:transketolase
VVVNGQQALGYTRDVMDTSPLVERWRAFGWDVHTVDGHDAAAIVDTLEGLPDGGGRPHAIVARTVFGRGVSFMEGRIEWHYLPLDESQ